MHHKSKQKRQKAWDDGVAPGEDEASTISTYIWSVQIGLDTALQ